MLIQPKPYMDKLRLRNHAVGVERRKNMSKLILENQTFFPKPVEYSDIDRTFFEWVDKKIDIVYDGKRLPTYKLFSNQKISEYSQTWSNVDDTGNIIMNFKTITRENNPQHGESQGGNYNVPGNRDYPMFYVPVLQENGEEAYDLYSMKQPLSVNFMYSVSIICNKYEILNKFNEMMHYEFSALECYISPNDHPMPMIIENITDESEYSIDDRKYYAQTYQIKVMAYIIRKEDYKVTKIPSRFKISVFDSNKEKKYKKTKKIDCWLGNIENAIALNSENITGINSEEQLPKSDLKTPIEVCENISDPVTILHKKPIVKIEEEYEDNCPSTERDPYAYKKVKIFIEFPYCEERSVTFTMDTTADIDTVEMKNVKKFIFKVNGIEKTFDEETKLNNGDEIYLKIYREDEYSDSSFYISGIDPESFIDTRKEYEQGMDEIVKEEDIYINTKGTD